MAPLHPILGAGWEWGRGGDGRWGDIHDLVPEVKGQGFVILVLVEVGERAVVGEGGVLSHVLEEWASAVVEVYCKGGGQKLDPPPPGTPDFRVSSPTGWSWGEVREVAVGLKLLGWHEGCTWVKRPCHVIQHRYSLTLSSVWCEGAGKLQQKQWTVGPFHSPSSCDLPVQIGARQGLLRDMYTWGSETTSTRA